MPRWTTTDRQHMRLALDLAQRGQGYVEPNPMAGCVIVKNKRIVGQGHHKRFGGPHAEPNALQSSGRKARGATVYITLEPCCHVGKTPPCCDALIRAQVRRVIVATKDPNPLVAGKGLKKLRDAGIPVNVGLLRDEAKALNAPFIKFHTERLPYVILKWAQSIDGKIATRSGDSRWITSRESRAASHALRARVDAIIVGVNTVIVDDPDLTARLVKPKRVAARIILDPNLRTPLRAKLVRTAREVPTIIVTAKCEASTVKREASIANRLERAGCEVLQVSCGRSGIRLAALLRELRDRGMTNVLVEGGGRALGAFLQRNLADEARIFVAPTLIGGEAAPGPLCNIGPGSMRELPKITLRSLTAFGPDLCYNIKIG